MVLPHGNIIKENERSEKINVLALVFVILTPLTIGMHTHAEHT